MVSASPASPLKESRAAQSSMMGGEIFLFAALIAAILSLYVAAQFSGGLMSFPSNRAEAAVAEDLVAFHRAGEMAIAGEAAAAYDPAQFRAALADHQKGLLWLNPPHAFLIMAPIAMLPYGVAKSAWVALGALSMLSIMMVSKLRAPALFVLALASPAMLISTLLLQFGPFIAIGLAAALTLAPKRPLIAGIVLALLTMKPQYGLMAPVFLAATGHNGGPSYQRRFRRLFSLGRPLRFSASKAGARSSILFRPSTLHSRGRRLKEPSLSRKRQPSSEAAMRRASRRRRPAC